MKITITKFIQALYNLWRVADCRTFLLYLVCIIRTLPQVISQKSLGPADFYMQGQRCHFKISDKKQITLVIDDTGAAFGLAREIYCQRVYLSIPNFEIQAEDWVIDLGANAGIFTVMAAALGANVVSVEAQPGYLPIIQKNLCRNNCMDRVNIEIGLIGAERGVFSVPLQAQRFAYWGEGSPPLNFADILSENNIPMVDFLKIDIEGSEFSLLENKPEWLKQVRKISMEVHPTFGDIHQLIYILRDAGFETFLYNKDLETVEVLQNELGFISALRKDLLNERVCNANI